MNAQRTGVVLLSRGEEVIARNPSLGDVVALMDRVYADQALGGAPEISIEYFNDEKGRNCCARLLLLPAFKENAKTKWVVHFSIPRTRGACLLSDGMSVNDLFEVRTTVGVHTAYKVECLLDDTALLRSAIEWFLDHHSKCPEQKWIGYFEATRYV